jgi:heat shock protein HtpX
LFGKFGLWFAFAFLIYSLMSFRGPPTEAVMNYFRARKISLYEAPELLSVFEDLIARARLGHVVDLYYLPTATPNAFAVGSGDSSAVCVSDGLLRMMSERELRGVLAHELAHIKHQDTRLMGLAQSMGRVTAILSRIGIFSILFSIPMLSAGWESRGLLMGGFLLFVAPMVNYLLQLSLSRTREFNADLGSAEITGDPIGLVSALEKLESMAQGGWLRRKIDPRLVMQEPVWLRTHPSTAERVKRLQEVASSIHEETSRDRSYSVPVPFAAPVQQKRKYRIVSGDWRFSR